MNRLSTIFESAVLIQSVLLLLLLTACSHSGGGGTPLQQVSPFHTPFDFNDDFYRDNGIDPTKLVARITPDHVSATEGTPKDPTRNNTRILQAFGGYDSVGTLLYYPLPPSPFKVEAFTKNEKGVRAHAVAN